MFITAHIVTYPGLVIPVSSCRYSRNKQHDFNMGIKLTFLGAAGGVTGSSYLVQTSQARVLVDFGMFQGHGEKEDMNKVPATLDPLKLDAVVLTHGHLDHCGRLPLLAKAGYRGPVITTEPTIPLASLVLKDSAHLQAMDAERHNRKHPDKEPTEPIYSAQDVDALIALFKPVNYDQRVEVAPGIRAQFVEAGHMLGSASIQLTITDGGKTKTIVFSGDIGPKGAPILKDAVGFHQADFVVMESTYGDRDHKPLAETVEEFEGIVKRAVASKGKLLVPVFAIGRTQLLLYLLAQMFRNRTVPKFPIFLDSPMAIQATKIYWEHMNLFDEEFQALSREKPLVDDLSSLKATPTAQDSMALNDQPGPALIMAGAGMCTGGRILHHLRHNLSKPDACVLIVGYQGEGSLGRRLVDGEKEVSMFGEKIQVKAQIHTLGGFSAHAGQTDLMDWLSHLVAARPRVFLTHGEARGREPLAQKIKEKFGLNAELPMLNQVANL